MKLLFKQRLFSWLDSYDIFDEAGNTVYTVKSKLAWGHCLKIFDAQGRELGTVKQKIITFLPKFEMYIGNQYAGCFSRELTLFKPKYNVDFNGWRVEGNVMAWDYRVTAGGGLEIASISKQLLRLTDTYVIDVFDPNNALCVLMLVLAIDAEKCTRSQSPS